jgi:flagellar basal body-associated protein FliL
MKILKSKNKSVISIIFHIFIFLCSLFILTELFSINSHHKPKAYTNIFTKRKLITSFEKQKIEDICQKADKDLILLYKSDSYSYVKDDIQMKKSTSNLLSYLENKNEIFKDKQQDSNFIYLSYFYHYRISFYFI